MGELALADQKKGKQIEGANLDQSSVRTRFPDQD
jgi:hypothetical protein